MRLLIEVLAILTILCVGLIGSTAIALHAFLLDQVDARLSGARHLSAQPYRLPAAASRVPPEHRHIGFLLGAPQQLGTVAVFEADGQVVDSGRLSLVSGAAALTALPAADTTLLRSVPVGAAPSTESLPGLGDYRVVATRLDDGRTLVLGLPLQDVETTVTRVALTMTAAALVALLLAGVCTWWILEITLRPLRDLAQTAANVTELPLDRGPVALPRVPGLSAGPDTEVGQLAAALDRMLAHVGAALDARLAGEARARQFVADASHELRTPLSAIRGYVHLAERRRAEVPTEVAEALDRVDVASARMATLVEELLLLARLDAEPAPRRELVDLSRILVEATAEAHLLAPDHEWSLDLPDEPVDIEGDAELVRRAVTNLLANARTHTPGGTRVRAGVRADPPDGATVLVEDDGPGVPRVLLPDLFERFTRGDRSRSRAAGSTGLGLAIVAAVASAHKGHVEVESRPGHTRFRLRLGGFHSGRTGSSQEALRRLSEGG